MSAIGLAVDGLVDVAKVRMPVEQHISDTVLWNHTNNSTYSVITTSATPDLLSRTRQLLMAWRWLLGDGVLLGALRSSWIEFIQWSFASAGV